MPTGRKAPTQIISVNKSFPSKAGGGKMNSIRVFEYLFVIGGGGSFFTVMLNVVRLAFSTLTSPGNAGFVFRK